MAASWLVIENPTTGETYAVSAATYRQRYEKAGFRVIQHENGEPWEPPAKKAAKAADDAQDAPGTAEGA